MRPGQNLMNIPFDLASIVTWLIVGLLAGSVTGVLVTRKKPGFGLFRNLVIGLMGALIGGVLFRIFHIDLGLGSVAISLEDLVAAFVGSLVFLLALWLIRKNWD